MRIRRDRRPSDTELALWRHAMRDVRRHDPADEAPLQAPPPPPPLPPSEPSTRSAVPRASEAPLSPPQRPPPPSAQPVDRRVWQRLRRGRYPVSARLDLHGLTQDQAWSRLCAFIAAEQARGSRCVLVITGIGARTGGVLRAVVPRWLDSEPNASRVVSFAPAGAGHGGDGALFVLLRRRK